ncbi:MAG: ankyrin repeat domain-containing protein [Azoarcus sp.]|nr:ankyrin repeat domain-containing protein [Azoarcus sp.]
MSKRLRHFPSGHIFAALLAVLVCFISAPVHADARGDALSAARKGNSATLVKLLESRAVSPDTVDDNGNSLLMLAVREGNADTVMALLRFNPLLDLRNRNGDSALMVAALGGNEKAINLLLDKGARTDHGGIGWTALHYAALEGKLNILERLLAARANVNALTPNLSDALMLAARNGHIDIVRRLLKTPIALDRRNERELTAEEWAREKGNTDIADLIKKARAAKRS